MSKDLAKRFPSDTPVEVVTPTTLPTLETDPLSLHLDQTIGQTVINGAPQFDEGIVIKQDKRIRLDGL